MVVQLEGTLGMQRRYAYKSRRKVRSQDDLQNEWWFGGRLARPLVAESLNAKKCGGGKAVGQKDTMSTIKESDANGIRNRSGVPLWGGGLLGTCVTQKGTKMLKGSAR